MCAGCSLVSLGFRVFFAAVARRGVWRLPLFFVAVDASDSGEGGFTSSAVFFFFGTAVQWLMISIRLSFIGLFASAFSPSLEDGIN